MYVLFYAERGIQTRKTWSNLYILGILEGFGKGRTWFAEISSRDGEQRAHHCLHWTIAILSSMAFSKASFSFIAMIVLLSSTTSLAHPGFGWGGKGGPFGGGSFGLFPEFYQYSCPQADDIVMSVLRKAIARDSRIPASLLRLHFHDCFVQVLHLVLYLSSSSLRFIFVLRVICNHFFELIASNGLEQTYKQRFARLNCHVVDLAGLRCIGVAGR